MKLCELPKVGLFLDTITHGSETRDGDEVKIVTLTLRNTPLVPPLASAFPGPVRMILFDGNADVRAHVRKVDFGDLGAPDQQLDVYASPDTADPSIAFHQCKVVGVGARIDKDSSGWALIVKVSFGPACKTQLEYIEEWRLTQRFVTFTPSQYDLLDELTDDAAIAAD